MKKPLLLSRFSRLFPWLAGGICVVLLCMLASWLIIPSYLKKTLEEQTQAQIGRQLTVSEVTFNPFTLTVNLSNLVLYEADNKSPAFSADNLLLKVSLSSLFHAAPVLREVVLTHPSLRLVRRKYDGKEVTNFNDVAMRLSTSPSHAKPLRYFVSNIQLKNGEIYLDDQIVGKNIQISALTIGLPFISNFSSSEDIFIEPSLSAKVNGSLFDLKGRSKPFLESHETDLAINMNRIDLTQLIAFLPRSLPFKVTSARFSSKLVLHFFTKNNVPNMALSGTASVNDVAMVDFSGAPLLKTKAIDVNIQKANVLTKNVVLNSLEITEPQLWIGLDKHGVLNWLAMTTDNKSSAETGVENKVENANTQQALFDLSHFQLKNGTLHWSDSANATPTMTMQLNNVTINAEKLVTSETAEPAKITVDFGEKGQQQAHFAGSLHLAHAAVLGELALSDVALSDYQPYLTPVLAAKVFGHLSLKTQLDVQNGDVSLHDFSGAISDLKLSANKNNNSDSGNTILAKKIAVQHLSMSSKTKQAKIEELALDQVQGNVFKDADGNVNLDQLLKSSAKKVTKIHDEQKPKKTKIANAPAWQAQINKLTLVDSNLSFGDKSVTPAVNVQASSVNAQLEQFSSTMEHPFKMKLHATLNKTGKFAVEGSVAQKNMQLKVDLHNFSVTALQPYFTEFLNINLNKGSVSTTGQLLWTAPTQINYQGMFKLADFSSSDKEKLTDFLRWKMLAIDGININLGAEQRNITLGTINLSDFYARMILSEEGKLNLQNIVVHQPAKAEQNKSTTEKVPTKSAELVTTIGKVNFKNGTINYTDNFIKPHYSMRMTTMNGDIGLVQSSMPKPAPINLMGKIDNDAPITVSGSFNPLITPIQLDIKMTANGIDLPRLTAYSAKYAGYPIEKGKMSMDVEYHIQNNQLTAKNALKLDQLTFGDKVESPDAIHLPLPLVISLLTDSNGQINLDLPISGSLNDPQFSIGGLIFRTLMNLIGKVITSPFSLLAHSFSHSEELAYVEFSSGSMILTDASKAKLDNLAKALEQRANLKLDIIGRADLEADTPGLRERRLSWQIKRLNEGKEETTIDKAENAKAANKAENAADISTENLTISAADRAKAIEKIYAAAKFDKPRNKLGFAKSLPTAEMESLILTNMTISEDDLRALANRRESAVRIYLTETAHVPTERLYMIAPKINGRDFKDKGAVTRVDFDLKM